MQTNSSGTSRTMVSGDRIIGATMCMMESSGDKMLASIGVATRTMVSSGDEMLPSIGVTTRTTASSGDPMATSVAVSWRAGSGRPLRRPLDHAPGLPGGSEAPRHRLPEVVMVAKVRLQLNLVPPLRPLARSPG